MGEIGKKLMGLIFGIFIIGVLGFMTYTAYSSISRITDNQLLRYGTLMFFDAGALVWFGVALSYAGNNWQRAFAAAGFCIGFLGTLALMASDIILGQTNVEFNSSQIYILILAVVIGAAAGHAALIYAFKTADSERMRKIREDTFEDKQREKKINAQEKMRKQIDKIQELALEQAEQNLQKEAQALSVSLGEMYADISRRELLTVNLLRLDDPRIIDAQAKRVDDGASKLFGKKVNIAPPEEPRRYEAATVMAEPAPIQEQPVRMYNTVKRSAPAPAPAQPARANQVWYHRDTIKAAIQQVAGAYLKYFPTWESELFGDGEESYETGDMEDRIITMTNGRINGVQDWRGKLWAACANFPGAPAA